MKRHTRVLGMLCLLPLWALAKDLTTIVKEQVVPGGVKRIIIHSTEVPIVSYQKRRVAVTGKPGEYTAIIGIPIDAAIGQHTAWQTSPKRRSYAFVVRPKAYQTQQLTIKNQRKVTPLPADQKRIDAEKVDFDRTLAYWQNVAPTTFPPQFTPPIRGPITSTFGLKRIYNGIPKSPHLALDIAASRGTPIKATADGRVANVRDRFYTGNTVIIDHGQGLMTLYAHLHETKVTNGQMVKRGQLIGTVGSTGRVTGPHLHWAVYLNQYAVNPLLFVRKQMVLPEVVRGSQSIDG